MSFLYFVPGLTRGQVVNADVASYGLGYAFAERPQIREVTGEGPGKQSGVILRDNPEGLGYFPQFQRWIPHNTAKAESPVWVGVDADVPTPETLAREVMLPGKFLELADGSAWHVPLIREFRDEGRQGDYVIVLPRVMGVDQYELSQGNYKLSWNAVDERFVPLMDIAAEYYDMFGGLDDQSDKPHRMRNIENLTVAAVQVLAANYRIALPEATLLNLFDSRGMFAESVLNYAALDWDNLKEWLKKNVQVSDGLNSSVGREDEPQQTIDPLTLTASP